MRLAVGGHFPLEDRMLRNPDRAMSGNVAVIAGVTLWTILWLGSNFALRKAGILPADPATPVAAVAPLLLLLAESAVISVVAGMVCAAIGGRGPALALGVVLLALGITAQAVAWHLLPVWYHAAFLLLLVPATLLGARLRRR